MGGKGGQGQGRGRCFQPGSVANNTEECDCECCIHGDATQKVPRRKLHKNRTNLNNLQIRGPRLHRPRFNPPCTWIPGNTNYTIKSTLAPSKYQYGRCLSVGSFQLHCAHVRRDRLYLMDVLACSYRSFLLLFFLLFDWRRRYVRTFRSMEVRKLYFNRSQKKVRSSFAKLQ